MPSVLKDCTLSNRLAEAEFEELSSWFSGRDEFTESEFVLELKKYSHLALMTSLLGETRHPDQFKHEFEIQGVFRADLVAGSSKAKSFTFVEFEGGQKNSLFGPKRTNQMRGWGAQLQNGIGQIIDWSWALNDAQSSSVFENNIGARHFKKTFVLVCGLNRYIDKIEESRLAWLNNNFLLSGSRALFMTYDDLMDQFSAHLDIFRDNIHIATNMQV
jgi:hypothetical protein